MESNQVNDWVLDFSCSLKILALPEHKFFFMLRKILPDLQCSWCHQSSILMFENSIYVWDQDIGELHNRVFFGSNKTIAMVEERFCGPSSKHDAAKLAIQCQTCQLAKRKRRILVFTCLFLLHTRLWQDLSMDFVSWIAKNNSKAWLLFCTHGSLLKNGTFHLLFQVCVW